MFLLFDKINSSLVRLLKTSENVTIPRLLYFYIVGHPALQISAWAIENVHRLTTMTYMHNFLHKASPL